MFYGLICLHEKNACANTCSEMHTVDNSPIPVYNTKPLEKIEQRDGRGMHQSAGLVPLAPIRLHVEGNLQYESGFLARKPLN